MDEALAFLDPQFRPSVCLAAYGFVVAFKGEWAHSNWEKFLAEEVAATGLGDLADDPAQRNALGSFLEELKALYHEEGEEAFARRMEEVREEVFKPSQPTGLLAVVGSNILGFWKSLLDWFRHLWAAELKAESLPRGIPLAVRGLLSTLFPVIKLKYVFVLIAAVFIGGWGTNALRYRAVVIALDARQFEAAQQAAAVLEESFLSRIHAFTPWKHSGLGLPSAGSWKNRSPSALTRKGRWPAWVNGLLYSPTCPVSVSSISPWRSTRTR